MIVAAMNGRLRAARGEQAARAWLAWHTAMLQRIKQPPPLAELMPREIDAAPKRPKTAAELEEIARSWAATA